MIKPMEEAAHEAYPTKVRVSVIGLNGEVACSLWLAQNEYGAREDEGFADAIVKLPSGEYQLEIKRFVEVADEDVLTQ